jgi:long-subunit fatty acid transport protein
MLARLGRSDREGAGLTHPAVDRRLGRTSLLGALCLAAVAPAAAQVEGRQEQVDFQGRSSVVLGAGARAFGMGGAFLARADDATAASWNPAGLSYLRRPEVSLVGAFYSSRDEGRTTGDTSTSASTDRLTGSSADFVSLAYPVSFGSSTGSVQLSYQRVIPVAGERHIRPRITEPTFRFFDLDLQGGFDVVALGTGLQVMRDLRVGITVNRWLNGFQQYTYRFRQFLGARARTILETQQALQFDLSGWNANLGVIWSPLDSLNIGMVGKTPFTGKVSMARRRVDFDEESNSITGNRYPDRGGAPVRVDFPLAVGVGLSLRPRSAFTISADYTRTFWSDSMIRNFFSLERAPAVGPPPVPTEDADTLFPKLPYPTLRREPPQADTEQLRLGAEYVIITSRLKLPVRAGYFTDRQYYRSKTGSIPRFNGFTVGTGLLRGPFLFDVAYVIERGDYLDPESEDRVFSHSGRLFVSLIYRHGASN